MHHFLKTYIYMLLAIVFTILQLACSKDTDLLDEMVLNDNIPDIENPQKATDDDEADEEPEAVPPAAETPIDLPVEDGYYVTTNGSASNDGLSEQTAWNLQHAINSASAGDLVYIKAGNYGNLQLEQYKSGTSDQPIRFVGYQHIPGDIQASQGSTFNYGDAIDANKMPLLSGSAPNGNGNGTAISIRGTYVEVKNIQITNYNTGVAGYAEYVDLNNIIVSKVGDFRPNIGGFSDYNGFGIRITGNNTIITNTMILNAGAEGISLRDCDDCEVTYTEVAADDNTNPTDYYILLTGGTNNAKIDNCTVRRKSGLEHFGHGFCLKAGATDNIISNSLAINTFMELQFSDVHDNRVIDSKITGTYNQNKDYAGGLTVANGANNNIFQNIQIDNVYSGLRFSDWKDGSNLPNDANDAGNNNQYIDVSVSNSNFGVDFNEFEKREGKAWNNEFIKCKFSNITTLFRVNRPNSGNKFISCTIENVGSLQQTSNNFGYLLSIDTIFETMNWVNIAFKLPQ